MRYFPVPLLMLAVTLSLPAVSGVRWVVGHASPQEAIDLPQGWHVYADDKLKDANEQDRRCFNISRNDWKVTVEADQVRIVEKLGSENDNLVLPARLVHQEGMTRLQSVMHVNNQWLLAYNGGEWGGGLWLTDDDGGTVKKIVDGDVQAVVARDDGILILSGLAHLTMDSGRASFYSLPRNMNMAFQWSVALDGAPLTSVKTVDGAVIFVTTHSLQRISKSGELKILHEFPKWTAYQGPNSIVISADGTIYVGMRMFVLELNDRDGEYTEEWLLPNDCQKFHMTNVGCACTS